MCGIAGIVHSSPKKISDAKALEAMSQTLRNRGPDDSGMYQDEFCGFAFRRLSIIDLNTGNQPLFNEDKTVCVICNGEIYNYRELRQGLEKLGHTFYTKSDVEVIPHLYEEKGEDFVNELNGMFALALWDKNSRKIILTRDRLGQKPLYYANSGKKLVFASELKAIIKHPDVGRDIDYTSLYNYLTYEYIPAPDTIFSQIKKLQPAQIAILAKGEFRVSTYWQLQSKEGNHVSEESSVNDIRKLFSESIKKRLISDVPLGLFLSGGLDSSLVAAIASEVSPKKLDCFSISFEDSSFDELKYAKQTAGYLGLRHYDQKFSPKMMMELIPDITSLIDEPLADASIIPTYLLSRFTRTHVKVALSGDGGDELFAGYPTYNAHVYAGYYKYIPGPLQLAFESMVRKLPTSTKNFSIDFKLKKFISAVHEEPLKRHIKWMGAFSPEEKERLVNKALCAKVSEDSLYEYSWNYLRDYTRSNVIEKMMYLDMKMYLQDDILTKVDRASMANSLEVRSPFLDHSLVEYISSLPLGFKLRRNNNKYILKKLAGQLLPANIINRPKKGFGIPLARWFKYELKNFVTDILNPSKIKRQGYFNPSYIDALLRAHFSGKKDNRKAIWTLLVFQMWHDRYMEHAS